MDIASLSEKCGIPQRKLRYVLDHGLVPGLSPRQQGRGNARQFDELEATALITAGSLFQFGVPAAHIRQTFAALGGISNKGRKVSAVAVLREQHLFILGSESAGLYFKRRQEWYKLPELTIAGRTPLVTVCVRLAAIRRLVREAQREHVRGNGHGC